MIRETPADLHATARSISEAKAVLEKHGEALSVELATRLCEAAEALARVQESQERARRRNMVTEEELAREMGYVNERGEVEKRQFAADMVKCGVERHKTSRTRAFYFRDEVEEAIRRLGE